MKILHVGSFFSILKEISILVLLRIWWNSPYALGCSAALVPFSRPKVDSFSTPQLIVSSR